MTVTVCAEPGCPELTRPGRNRCPTHDPGPWAGSTRRRHLPPDWPQRRAAVLERDGHRCTIVENGERCPRPATEVHHTNGRDDHRLEMLAAICAPHHARESAREGVEARSRRSR